MKGKERKGKERKGKERKGKERASEKPCIKSHKSVIFHVVVGAEPLARSE
jgi:hypothetical protein